MKTVDINQLLRLDRRSCARGAPMGDRNTVESTSPLYLQRVRFIDGDYAPDGTYWGASRTAGPIWCAFNGHDYPDYAAAKGTRIYVRAHTRKEAVEKVLKDYPDMTFKRSSGG